MEGLRGRTAFITGGARGQGRSHAVALAREGCNSVLVDICDQLPTVKYPMATREDMEETIRLVKEAGADAIGVVADVRRVEQMRSAVEQGVEHFGQIHFLIANAGIQTFDGQTHEISEEVWDETIDVMFRGVWNTFRAVLPHLIEKKFGRTVVTGSMGMHGGMGNNAHYVSAKYACEGIVKSVAIEQAERGITCNIVLPTCTNTRLLQNDEIYHLMAPHKEHPTMQDAIEPMCGLMSMRIPWVEPEEISAAMLYLLSDGARHITGIELPVNGGWNASM